MLKHQIEKDDKNVTADYVISTDPKSGEQVSKDTQITIYYSSGKGKTKKRKGNGIMKATINGITYEGTVEEIRRIVENPPCQKIVNEPV